MSLGGKVGGDNNLGGTLSSQSGLSGTVGGDYDLAGNLSAQKKVSGRLAGLKTIHGYSAYEIAVINGFRGTEEEWLASLRGVDGEDGANVVGATVNDDGHLIFTLSDGNEIDCGFAKGGDGFSPTVSVYEVPSTVSPYRAGFVEVTFTDADGEKSFTIHDGARGPAGLNGLDGIPGSILTKIQKNSGDGSPGTTDEYVVYQKTYIRAANGLLQEFELPLGGSLSVYNGADGDTPEKGVDYYTEAERQAFVAEILAALNANTPAAKIGEVTLLASAWVGDEDPYSQVVEIDGVTENSQVDLTPSVEQLAIFHDKDLAFVTENDGGVVTVYAVGQKPENDYEIQVTITEVSV